MTAYEYANIPDNFEMIEPLPDDMVSEGVRLIKSARESGLLMAQEVKIAHLYDRKGYATMDTFGGQRNVSYSSDNDDVVIQVTVRIQNPQMFAGLQSLGNILIERKAEAARLAKEAEKARLQAELETIQTKLNALG